MQWLTDRLNWMRSLVESHIEEKKTKNFWNGYLQATLEIQKLMEDEEKRCVERLEADYKTHRKKLDDEYKIHQGRLK